MYEYTLLSSAARRCSRPIPTRVQPIKDDRTEERLDGSKRVSAGRSSEGANGTCGARVFDPPRQRRASSASVSTPRHYYEGSILPSCSGYIGGATPLVSTVIRDSPQACPRGFWSPRTSPSRPASDPTSRRARRSRPARWAARRSSGCRPCRTRSAGGPTSRQPCSAHGAVDVAIMLPGWRSHP